MADLTSFIPSLLSPVAPIIPGYQGQGRADLADMIVKQRQGDDEDAFKAKQLAQQGEIAANTNKLGMFEAQSRDAYYKQQAQLRQDALDEKAKAERDRRVNTLRDMLAKARQTGDRSMIASIHSELQRMGWSVRESGEAPPAQGAPPSSLSPAGLPEAPPPAAAPAEETPQASEPDVISGPSGATVAPGKAPMMLGDQSMNEPPPSSLAPAGLPQATHPAAYYKLSPEAQAALGETLQQNPGLSESQLLGMFNHESQMDAKRPNGVGNTGLYQLSDKQAPGLVGKPHLSDLSDADQVRSYPNYLKKTGLDASKPVNNTDLILAQIAPSKIGTRDPNAVIYTPEEVASWGPKTRAINAPMVGADGAVRLASLLKGYTLNDGGKASPDVTSAASVLSPGGLPSAPPAPRQGGRFEYRDESGALVDTYDQNAEDDRASADVRDALRPLMSANPTPREQTAAKMAIEYGVGVAKRRGADKGIVAATQLFENQSKEPALSGANGAAALEQRRLINNDSQSTKIIDDISGTEGAKALANTEATVAQGLDLLHSGSGLADKTALAQLTKGLYGANQSDKEFMRTLNADGFFSGLQNKINNLVDGGRLDEALRSDLEKVLTLSQQAANRRRVAMGDEAYHRVMTSLSVGTPEERQRHAAAARAHFLRDYGDQGDGATGDAAPQQAAPAAPAPAPRGLPAAPPRVTAPAENAIKSALDRARKVLGVSNGQ